MGVIPEFRAQPDGELRRELRVDPKGRHYLRGDANDFAALGSELQACANVIVLQVRKIREDLRFRYVGGKHFQDVTYANTHAANARPTAALQRVERNAIHAVFACIYHERNHTPEVGFVNDFK